jgi:hypothetical protein
MVNSFGDRGAFEDLSALTYINGHFLHGTQAELVVQRAIVQYR